MNAEQKLAAIAAILNAEDAPTGSAVISEVLDPLWYTPMSADERAAWLAAHPLLEGGWVPPLPRCSGILARDSARYGWSDRGTGVGPETLELGFAKNLAIATMSDAEFEAAYGPITRELACYLNLTNRANVNPNKARTVAEWTEWNDWGSQGTAGVVGL